MRQAGCVLLQPGELFDWDAYEKVDQAGVQAAQLGMCFNDRRIGTVAQNQARSIAVGFPACLVVGLVQEPGEIVQTPGEAGRGRGGN